MKPEKPFSGEIDRKAQRKQRARQRREHDVWFWLGMFGLVGWSVSIPALVGTAIGAWLDRHVESEASWTLTLLLIGMALGCLQAWHWVKQESRKP